MKLTRRSLLLGIAAVPLVGLIPAVSQATPVSESWALEPLSDLPPNVAEWIWDKWVASSHKEVWRDCSLFDFRKAILDVADHMVSGGVDGFSRYLYDKQETAAHHA